MLAWVYRGNRTLELATVAVPDVDDDGVLVEISHCGICGTDLHNFVEGWAQPGTTGSCTGAGGVNLSADLNLTGTAHTSVGSYPSDQWSFTDLTGNYTNPGGAVTDVIAAPLPAIAQVHVNYPDDPQDVLLPPSDVTHCPAQDSDDGGCAINVLDGTIDNVFDASSSIDPNVNPSHDTVEYHWQIFYPSIFGEQVLWSSAGITGYHSPVLHIVAGFAARARRRPQGRCGHLLASRTDHHRQRLPEHGRVLPVRLLHGLLDAGRQRLSAHKPVHGTAVLRDRSAAAPGHRDRVTPSAPSHCGRRRPCLHAGRR
jgi:hypothetical protein